MNRAMGTPLRFVYAFQRCVYVFHKHSITYLLFASKPCYTPQRYLQKASYMSIPASLLPEIWRDGGTTSIARLFLGLRRQFSTTKRRIRTMPIYTIVGATSDVGKRVSRTLEDMGHHVRKVSRSFGISIDDEEALFRAFSGIDGAYVMMPIDMQASDVHQREDEIGEKLARAIQAAQVKR